MATIRVGDVAHEGDWVLVRDEDDWQKLNALDLLHMYDAERDRPDSFPCLVGGVGETLTVVYVEDAQALLTASRADWPTDEMRGPGAPHFGRAPESVRAAGRGLVDTDKLREAAASFGPEAAALATAVAGAISSPEPPWEDRRAPSEHVHDAASYLRACRAGLTPDLAEEAARLQPAFDRLAAETAPGLPPPRLVFHDAGFPLRAIADIPELVPPRCETCGRELHDWEGNVLVPPGWESAVDDIAIACKGACGETARLREWHNLWELSWVRDRPVRLLLALWACAAATEKIERLFAGAHPDQMRSAAERVL